MIKILYILPVLAVLGMISGADATADQERIDELEAKIDRLETKIDRLEDRIDRLDPATDQKRIDKIEAKIDKFEARIDKFEAQIDRLEARDNDADTTEKDTGDTTQTQQERYSRGTAEQTGTPDKGTPATSRATIGPDTAPPAFVSAQYNTETGTLTITFSEPVDASEVLLDDMHVFEVNDRWEVYWSLVAADLDRASDSATLTLELNNAYQRVIGELEIPKLGFEAGAVRDVAGNQIGAATDLQIAIFPEPPPPVIPDPSVTIESTPTGDRFVANVDMIELESGADTFTVEFVNNGSTTHEVLIDLLFGSSSHSRNVTINPTGEAVDLIFDVPDSMVSGDTAYLLFGVWGDQVKGDHHIKVSIP